MATEEIDALAPLVRKLGRMAALDARDLAAIGALAHRLESVKAGQLLVREGAAATPCCLLIDGYACRHKLAASGARQIVAFQLAGDLLDLQHLLLAVADHNVQMMTAGQIAWIAHADIARLARERPRVGEALWRETLIDASIVREWVLNVGRRDARSRIAHLLCEFSARREAAGLGAGESFELPMTQEEIADATGLTGVHVNRMLKALADGGVIARDRRKVRIVDRGGLRAIADFDAAYLHAAA